MLIPLVISDLLARHDAQVLTELGAMGIPHMQHRTFTYVPAFAGAVPTSMV